MTIAIGRRKFLSAIGGAAVAGPLTARAQQPTMPVIGWISSRSQTDSADVLSAFSQGLSEIGLAEGKTLAIEYSWADGQYDRLPALVSDLVQRPVNLIVAVGGATPVRAAMAATSTIPIVFVMGDLDPVKSGLVASINRPGGNITGVTPLLFALGAKRLQLLAEMTPKVTAIGMLVNPINPYAELETGEVRDAAHSLGLQLHVVNASNDSDIDLAFGALVQRGAGALLLTADSSLFIRLAQLVALATRHAVPAISPFREFAAAGGLMSYGASLSEAYRQAGVYVGRILMGKRPADLPVIQPTKFDLAINLKAAKSLGLTVPPTLLATADEVIE